ncbi:hypothetical protein, conserved [Plasmodium gonderi]|uniref:riboflavin kinase n=1 Tax=Plasmodium gonderi TaxID=77519 RepID=A0A1Y1JJT1_PLAGO|nr:hypothetical protein, conserved [Plasmodium gonderi]GAW81665.1 hypothetical protein, conserved [Plasmodium gonderi]
MGIEERKKRIAFIDTDYYIINYKSTITTYIQNICNNLLSEKDDSSDEASNDWNIKKRKKIICIFMLNIFLNNMHRNLNIFAHLHDILIKYHHLMVQSKTIRTCYHNGKIKSENDNMNGSKCDETNETTQGNGIFQKRQKEERWEETEIPMKLHIGKNEEQANGECCNPEEKVQKNGSNGEDISQFLHNMIEDKNYVNMDNVAESKLCFLSIKNKEINARSTLESLSNMQNTVRFACASEFSISSKNGGTILSQMDKGVINDEGDINGNHLCSNNLDRNNNSITNQTSIHWIDMEGHENIGEEGCLEDPYDESFDESQGSTYRYSNSSPVCSTPKQFLINYSNTSVKVKSFDNLMHMENIIERKKKKKNDKGDYWKELENMYRIIVLSKLHVGVYNFLTFLKKKNFFFVFYSSNKKLTDLLFKYFKITKNFKNCSTVIDEFEKLKIFINSDSNVFIFSNRACFINSAKKEGYFKVVGGKKNPFMTTSCDDINWDVLIENDNINSITSDYVSNKYNDVVYPFVRNCNLTEDVLSWRIFYIFKKYLYMHGKVVKGFGRGSKYLNIPTANIAYSNVISTDIMPGIYFGISMLKKKIYKTVVSIGYNPFFENKHITIEAFLYYKTNNLFYNEDIHLIIIGILRSESNFSHFSHLIHAIQYDCELTRIILNMLQNDYQLVQCRNYLESL